MSPIRFWLILYYLSLFSFTCKSFALATTRFSVKNIPVGFSRFKAILTLLFRGAIVKWLEWLGFCTECRREILIWKPGLAIRRLEISVNIAVNRYLFSQGRKKKRVGSASFFFLLFLLAQDNLSLQPIIPYSVWEVETNQRKEITLLYNLLR